AMNTKATELHLDNTSFRNPSGVESYNHYTSARDLAVLAAHFAEIPLLSEIVATKNITVTDVSGQLIHRLDNTNELLGELEGVKGMKTGWTENAGECLVTYVEREGRGVIIVVLGSKDRFGDTEHLVDWVYSHHTWVTPQL
ncbi:D-alanyl-D-alanine carboxypeptidase, partial [Patescibacteria group bacterium]|nr:D-alanyl-D-alanine carboxypeptidase [Patescibacteria group bacterium]